MGKQNILEKKRNNVQGNKKKVDISKKTKYIEKLEEIKKKI